MRLILRLCITLFSASLCAGDLEDMYKNEETILLTAETFSEKYGKFKWGGKNQRIAMSKSSTLFEHKIRESIAYFSAKGRLKRLDAWIYNRGDDGDMTKKEFEKKYKKLIGELSTYFESKPKRTGIDGVTRSMAYVFTLPNKKQIRLLVGFQKSPYRADFLNLIIRNKSKEDRIRKSGALEFLVKKDGDVYIDKIPMIDQGPKGYCVPATLARIGQHYNVDVSMHEIAMIADSSSEGGTSVRAALAGVKKNSSRMRLKIKDIKFVYADLDLRKTASPLALKGKAGELFKTLKDKDRRLSKFKKEIKKRIDKGLIVTWSLIVGLLPENGKAARQGGGGHMRIIIGYNDANDEFIFSDTWGPGHELKRIKCKAAYIVTTGLYEINPR